VKWKYLIGWLPMVLIAIFNGAFREIVYKRSLGDLRAHQLSTAIGIILLGVYIWFLIGRWRHIPEELCQILVLFCRVQYDNEKQVNNFVRRRKGIKNENTSID
jgi:hypothetical protein